MRTAVKLLSYAIGLILIFGVTAAAGRVLGPDQKPAPATTHPGNHAEMSEGDQP